MNNVLEHQIQFENEIKHYRNIEVEMAESNKQSNDNVWCIQRRMQKDQVANGKKRKEKCDIERERKRGRRVLGGVKDSIREISKRRAYYSREYRHL